MIQRYFQVEVKNLSFGAIRRISVNTFELVVAWFVKICRLHVSLPTASGYPNDLVIVAPDAVSETLIREVQPAIDEFRSGGIAYEFYYRLPVLGPMESVKWVGLTTDGTLIPSATVSCIDVGPKIVVNVHTDVVSFMETGRELVTSKHKGCIDHPEEFETERIRKPSPQQLITRHRERVAEHASRPVVQTVNSVEENMLRAERRVMDWMMERNAFVELDHEKVRLLRRTNRAVPATGHAKQPAGGSMGALETACWIMTGIGIWYSPNDAVNDGQWLFRVGILTVGIVGAVGLMLYRLVKTSRLRTTKKSSSS